MLKLQKVKLVLRPLITAGLLLLLTGSNLPQANELEQIRAYTRMIEFDYVNWTLNAVGIKGQQAALNAGPYLPLEQRKLLVLDYLTLVGEINETRAVIEQVSADPQISDPAAMAAPYQERLEHLEEKQAWLGPLSESIVQGQLEAVLVDMGMHIAGESVPPVLYRVTQMPLALIVSPRSVIRQDADISLQADLSLDEIIRLEQQVEAELGVSALVENIGGVGVYPTMVTNTTHLSWLFEVVSHEWTHNFLTLRPLGINYYTSNELRTMNETAASIAGVEISGEIVKLYYENPNPSTPSQLDAPDIVEQAPELEDEPNQFDFRKEMHETRVTVDQMLSDGHIEEAEDYMEMRRVFLWENGYRIRRLNQAYFSFHGAYADQPGGAAGSDPVGPAVRMLREQSDSLADFLNRISWMDSYEDLIRAVEQPQP
jgi:hypothetical protein